jgi:hypothetical protein
MSDQLHDFDLSALTGEVATRARDAAYVAVGLGVLGFQQAQVRRHELARRAVELAGDERVQRIRTGVSSGVRQLSVWFDGTVQFVETSLPPIGEQLSPATREAAEKARERVRQLGAQLRQLTAPGA